MSFASFSSAGFSVKFEMEFDAADIQCHSPEA
jgi:hypothetical protein